MFAHCNYYILFILTPYCLALFSYFRFAIFVVYNLHYRKLLLLELAQRRFIFIAWILIA